MNNWFSRVTLLLLLLPLLSSPPPLRLFVVIIVVNLLFPQTLDGEFIKRQFRVKVVNRFFFCLKNFLPFILNIPELVLQSQWSKYFRIDLLFTGPEYCPNVPSIVIHSEKKQYFFASYTHTHTYTHQYIHIHTYLTSTSLTQMGIKFYQTKSNQTKNKHKF